MPNIAECPLLCDPCGKIFHHENTFKVHYQQQHNGDGAIGTVCKNEFKNTFLLKNNFTKYHTTKECDKCGKNITSGNYAQHLKMHKRVEHKCGKCSSVFPRKFNLDRHEKQCGIEQHQVEPAVENYQCQLWTNQQRSKELQFY
jgi:hypothetical protein